MASRRRASAARAVRDSTGVAYHLTDTTPACGYLPPEYATDGRWRARCGSCGAWGQCTDLYAVYLCVGAQCMTLRLRPFCYYGPRIGTRPGPRPSSTLLVGYR